MQARLFIHKVVVLDQDLFKVDQEDLVTYQAYHQVKETMVVAVLTLLALILVLVVVEEGLEALVALALTLVEVEMVALAETTH